LRGQGVKRKIAAAGKVAASAITAEPKRKKMKVLTHRSRYIEPAMIPELGEGASSATKGKETVPPSQRTEDPATMPKLPSAEPVETKASEGKAKESIIEGIKVPEILSPSSEVTMPKAQKSSTTTPKRRRMANVLDVVLETAKTLSYIPRKIVEASKAQPEAETKAGRSRSCSNSI
jgi:hypothetical protein